MASVGSNQMDVCIWKWWDEESRPRWSKALVQTVVWHRSSHRFWQEERLETSEEPAAEGTVFEAPVRPFPCPNPLPGTTGMVCIHVLRKYNSAPAKRSPANAVFCFVNTQARKQTKSIPRNP